MPRGFSRRLARLEAWFARAAAVREAEHNRRSARKIVLKAIRAGLARSGIDPGDVPVLRRFEKPDPPPRPTPLERMAGGELNWRSPVFDELRRLARRCREHPPPLADCLPAMLFALCCFPDDEAAPG